MQKTIKKNKVATAIDKKIIFSIYFVLACVFSVYCIFPLFWTFYNSFKSVPEYYNNTLALPHKWDLVYYNNILKVFSVSNHGFLEMVWNSVWMAFGSQILNIAASLLVAYPLAKYKFPLRNFFYGIIVFRITIPIFGAGSAAYKLYRALGMVNNPLNYSLTWFVGFDMTALILYGYFRNIDKGYSEAAFIDGANRLQTFLKVILPQAFPCIIALYINAVKNVWGDYGACMFYLRKFPNLSYGIYLFESEVLFVEGGTPMFYGAIVLSSIVPLTLFAAGQKSMLKNLSVGGLKG